MRSVKHEKARPLPEVLSIIPNACRLGALAGDSEDLVALNISIAVKGRWPLPLSMVGGLEAE